MPRTLLAAAFVLSAATPATAQTWNGPTGSFQDPTKWSPATVPGPGSAAVFSTPASNFLASFDSDWSVSALTVSQGTTSLALNGHTLTAPTLNFATISGLSFATLTVTDGTLITNGGFGFGNGTNFNLTLDAAKLSANSFTDMANSAGTTVNVTVRNGSIYSAGSQSFIGSSGAATVTVDGPGSSFVLDTNARIGSSSGSSGTVNVTDGGAFRTTGSLSIGANTGATGAVTLSGAGSSWSSTDGQVLVGGGTAGTVTVNTGTTMAITGTGAVANVTLNTGGTMTVAGTVTITGVGQSGITLNGGTLTLNTGAAVTVDYFSRGVGVAGPTLNDGLFAVNKSFDLGVAPLTVSGNSASAGPTLQIQNGATATGITTLLVGNGVGRRGTFNVLGESTATLSSQLLLAGAPNSAGTVLVDGAGSKLVSAQAGGSAVVIGFSGAGAMTVQNGGIYQGDPISQNVVLGQQNGSAGTLTVTGSGSSVTTGGVSVGQGGPGTVAVLAGGTLSAGRVQIGEVAGGAAGSVTVSGPGSTLTSPSGLFIGGTAVGAGATGSQMTISNGGAVTATTSLGTQSIIYGGSTLTINGGSLTTGNLTRLGTLNFYDGTLTVNAGFVDAGNSATPLSIQGNAAGTMATLQISGSTTSNLGTLAVGGTRPGAVVIGPGGNVTPNAVTFATAGTGNGAITLSGPNAVLTVNGPMTFGSTGQSSLSIGAGSAVTVAGTLTLGSAGTVNVNGGALTVGGFAANGGAVNWTTGTVAFTGTTTLGAAELTTLLGPGGTLSAGRTLKGSTFSGNALTLAGNLSVTGGTLTAADVINTATLSVAAGTVQGTASISNPAGSLLSLANGATLSGQTFNGGEVQLGGGAARLTGQLSNSGRVSGTGTVTGNLINNPNGVVSADAGQRLVFGGGASVNGSNATIQMTGGTIEFTGQLSNLANGLISGRGVFRGSTANASGTGLNNTGAVAFSAGTSDVFGKVTNGSGGVIVTAGGGITTFHDDVVHNGTEIRTNAGSRTVFFGSQSGAGPFTGAGTVEYNGDLRPGNSPARVTYDGEVILNPSARFDAELGGTTPGSQYDELAVFGSIAVGGQLQLQFINGFTPQPGESFKLIENRGVQSIAGTFAGLNEGSLFTAGGVTFQATYLGGNGHDFVVTAVPEPGALALCGVAAVGWVAYWRRRWRAAHRTGR
ncbi:MAG TPA: hypothetical protein VGF55_08525 [Gemmataceae bacterium]|jgi:T5SS/PEP-CTERM-associated repeat protein